jgi:hypothetical protein
VSIVSATADPLPAALTIKNNKGGDAPISFRCRSL